MASFGFPFPFLPLYLNPIEKGFGYDLRIGLITAIKLSAQPLTYIVFQCEERSIWKQPLFFQFFCNIGN